MIPPGLARIRARAPRSTVAIRPPHAGKCAPWSTFWHTRDRHLCALHSVEQRRCGRPNVSKDGITQDGVRRSLAVDARHLSSQQPKVLVNVGGVDAVAPIEIVTQSAVIEQTANTLIER